MPLRLKAPECLMQASHCGVPYATPSPSSRSPSERAPTWVRPPPDRARRHGGPPAGGYAERDLHVVVALLHLWEPAGLSSEAILAAVEAGELSWSRRSPQGGAAAGQVHQGENLGNWVEAEQGLESDSSRKPVHQESFEVKQGCGPAMQLFVQKAF